MQLYHMLGARRLVQAIDVLRDDGTQLAPSLELRKLPVCLVGAGLGRAHHLAVEVEELLGVSQVKVVKKTSTI